MEFFVKTNRREEIIDITEKIKELVEGKRGKAVLIFTPHTTCGIIINEVNNKDICEDLLNFLKKQVPQGKWKHNCQEKNGDSHIKASLLGNSVIIPIENGKLMLGTYQRLGLAELDGARERKVLVSLV